MSVTQKSNTYQPLAKKGPTPEPVSLTSVSAAKQCVSARLRISSTFWSSSDICEW